MNKNTRLKKSFERTVAYYQGEVANCWKLNHEPDNIKGHPLQWNGRKYGVCIK
ncbi:MAG TPA: hypothetical protein VFR61_07000 [Nitrososphaeraceae archaeon]|jgi:hypothetical protein|nr:hypothetical protein [Nitrososphaeraceae archaeon]